MALPLRPSYLQRDTANHRHLNRVKAHSSIYTYILEGVRDHHLPLHPLYIIITITIITRSRPPYQCIFQLIDDAIQLHFKCPPLFSCIFHSSLATALLAAFLMRRVLSSSQYRRHVSKTTLCLVHRLLSSHRWREPPLLSTLHHDSSSRSSQPLIHLQSTQDSQQPPPPVVVVLSIL